MRWRLFISLFLAWAMAFQAAASTGGHCRHAAAKAAASGMAMDMNMAGMEHVHHHHGGMDLQHDGDPAKVKSDCQCGCDCGGGTCAHACHATALSSIQLYVALNAPSSVDAPSYTGLRLSSHATPPLRPPSAL